MEIPKCKNCKTEFKYKDLLKDSFIGSGLVCKNCGTVHGRKFISRVII